MNLMNIFSYYRRSNDKHQNSYSKPLHPSGRVPGSTGTPASHPSSRQAGQITSLFGEGAFSSCSPPLISLLLNHF